MSKVIVWELPDQTAVIEYPAYNDILREPSDTDDKLIARCIELTKQRLKKEHGKTLTPMIIEEDQIPAADSNASRFIIVEGSVVNDL